MGHVTSFGRSNWRGLSCRAAAESSRSGFRDPAAISSGVNSKSARLSSCSVYNGRGVGVDDDGLLVDWMLVAVPLADCCDDDNAPPALRYFVLCCSLWRLRELQFDAVSSSWDFNDTHRQTVRLRNIERLTYREIESSTNRQAKHIQRNRPIDSQINIL